jgi:hypothetical protein
LRQRRPPAHASAAPAPRAADAHAPAQTVLPDRTGLSPVW